MEDTIFTKIIRREIPAEILYEDDQVIVILNRFPNIQGETLVITKAQVSYVFDLETETYQHLMSVTRRVARALDRAFATMRTCVVIEGFEVPHVHVRLYPVTKGVLETKSGPEASDEALRHVADMIRPYLVERE